MFDNINMSKGFTLTDNITGDKVEIATFNATLTQGSNIHVYMNINYPSLYDKYVDDILLAYREFNANITSLAITMNLANMTSNISTLGELEGIRDELNVMVKDVMTQVINSLGTIEVNPVPRYEIGVSRNDDMTYLASNRGYYK